MKKQIISIILFLSPYVVVTLLMLLSNISSAQMLNKGALKRQADLKYCQFIKDKLRESSKITGGINPFLIEHRRNLPEEYQDSSPQAVLIFAQEFNYPALLKKIQGKAPSNCNVGPYRDLLRFGEKFKKNDFLEIVEVVKDDLRELKETTDPGKKRLILEEANTYCDIVLSVLPDDVDAKYLKEYVVKAGNSLN